MTTATLRVWHLPQILLCLAFVVGSRSAPAAIVIQELFDYAGADVTLHGQGDTTSSAGFAAGSTWAVNAGNTMYTARNFNVESSPALPGLPPQLTALGGLWKGGGNDWNTAIWATRQLAAPVDFNTDQVLYFSVRLNNSGDTAAGMGFSSGSTAASNFVGLGGHWGNHTDINGVEARNSLYLSYGTLNQDLAGNNNGPYAMNGGHTAQGSLNGPALIVGRLTLRSAGDDTVDLKQYNPGSTMDIDPGAVSWTLSASSNLTMSASHLLLWLNGSGQGELDAVRIGATWSDVTGAPPILTWTGDNGSEWSTNPQSPNKNWLSEALSADYADGNCVAFNDLATGTTIVDISVADVKPGSVVFGNTTAKSYDLQGSKGIAGTTGLTKSGSGALTISNTNSYTGVVKINGGTLVVGAVAAKGVSSPLGAGSSMVFGGGTLQYTGTDAAPRSDRDITVNAWSALRVDNVDTNLTLSGVISGAGGLAQWGPGTLTFTGNNSYTGGTEVNDGTLCVASIVDGASSNLGGTTGGNSGYLTLVNGTLRYTGDGASSTVRNLWIDRGAGTFDIAKATGSLTWAWAGGAVNRDITKTGPGTLALNGPITGSAAVTVSEGTLMLGGANTYTGFTTINGGTLQVGTGAATGNLGTGGVTNNGALVFNRNNLITVGNTIDGSGSFTQAGSGAVVLTAGNTFSGPTNVASGKLYVNGSLNSSSPITVAAGATLGGTGSAGTAQIQAGGAVEGGYEGAGTLTLEGLSFLGAGTMNLTPSLGGTPLLVTFSDGLSVSAENSVTINANGGELAPSTYHLVSYNGILQGPGGFDPFNAFRLGATPGGFFTYSLHKSAGYIDLEVVLTGFNWTGLNSSGEWSTATLSPKNWTLQGTPSDYADGRSVLFDDSVDPNGTTTVIVSPADVTPLGVVFANSDRDYTLTGAKGIAGPAALMKRGMGVLTIQNTNSFTGAVTLNGGTVSVAAVADAGVNSPLGAGSSLVLGGGTLQYTGTDSAPGTNRAVTLNVGGGTLKVANAATLLTIGGVIDGPGALTKTGDGAVALTAVNTYSGGTNLNGGTIQFSMASNLGAAAAPLAFDGGGLRWATANTLDITSGRTVSIGPDGATLDTKGNNVTLAGALVGSGGALTKAGDGTLSLTSSGNTGITGPITVSGGTLVAGTGGSIGSSQTLNVDNGATLLIGATNILTPNHNTPATRVINVTGGTLQLRAATTNRIGNLTLSGGAVQTSTWQDANWRTFYFGTVDGAGTNAAITVTGSAPSFFRTDVTANNDIQLGPNVNFNVEDVTGNPESDLIVLTPLGNGTADQAFAPGGLTKDGSGTILLSGANIFTGNMTVSNGTLKVTGDGRLYSGTYNGTAVVTVQSGGVLELETWGYGDSHSLGQLRAASNAIVLSGGTVRVDGATSYGRGITIDAAGATLEAAAGANWTLNVTDGNSPIMNPAGNLTLSGAGTGKIDKDLSGSGALTKSGPGRWTLTGANTYSGGTMVSEGILQIDKAGALPAGNSLTIESGGTVVLASGLTVLGAATSLATPVPEPSTLALLGIGAIGPLAWGWRRRKQMA